MQSQCLHGMCWLPLRLHSALQLEQTSLSTRTLYHDLPHAAWPPPSAPNSPGMGKVGAAAAAAAQGDGEDRAEGSAQAAGWGGGSKRRLQAVLLPDYLALVGKKAVGLPGAGCSSDQAVSLLRRFGSVQGIARAVQSGQLSARLQPIQQPSKQARKQLNKQSSCGCQPSTPPQGRQQQQEAAGAVATTGLPPGLHQALVNLQVALLTPNTLLLMRGLSKAGWQLQLLPFWELLPSALKISTASAWLTRRRGLHMHASMCMGTWDGMAA
ncbi:hypothetical protein V8C86DRAFT_3024216 [Haematococcus lacustris]